MAVDKARAEKALYVTTNETAGCPTRVHVHVCASPPVRACAHMCACVCVIKEKAPC